MEYAITHTTRYTYSNPVSVCQNLLALTPRDGDRVRCWQHRLRIRPIPPSMHRRTDYFGNILTVFAIEESHAELIISAFSRVAVRAPNPSPPGLGLVPTHEQIRQHLQRQSGADWYSLCPFLFDSPRVRRSSQFADYALDVISPGSDILSAAVELSGRIHRDFQYDTKATHAHTPTEESFSIRRGVCQDFSHVMIACLRSIGIPARYVSGYLKTVPPEGKPRLVGADQSHAWVAVYCGNELGWVELDPTNDCLCGLDHIPIAWGRDYTDVVPVRGAYLGGGESTIHVSVDVVPQEPVLR